MLAGIAVVGALGCGCGTGPATIASTTGAGPVFAADPHLREAGPRPATGSAADAAGVARQIAARWSAPGAPAVAIGAPIEFRTIDYNATVFNPGSPGGFTAFVTTRQTTAVTADSAATIDASNAAAPGFATAADQAQWQAAGRPALERAPDTGQTQTVPAGQFTFLPQGNQPHLPAGRGPADGAGQARRRHRGPPELLRRSAPAGQPGTQAARLPDRDGTTDRRGALGRVAGRGLAPRARFAPVRISHRSVVCRRRRRPDAGERRHRYGRDRHDRGPAAAHLVGVPACCQRDRGRI